MYSIAQDVRNALTPGADAQDTGSAAGLLDAQIEDAISEADSVIDSFLSSRYSIPTVSIAVTGSDNVEVQKPVAPFPVRFWSRDIAAYLATLTYKKNKDVPPEDPVRLRYALALQMLERVASGDHILPFPPPGSGGDASGIAVVNPYEGDLWDLADFNIGPVGVDRRYTDLGWNRAE